MNQKEKILLYSSNIWNFAYAMFGPFLAIFTEQIGGSLLDVSWALAIYLVATGLFEILVGNYSDRHNKLHILLLGYFLTSIFTFGYLIVSTPFHLFIIQAGLGLALSLCNPTWYALFDENSTKKSTGRIWGLADGESKIVSGIAIIIGGFIVSSYSFDVLFVAMGVLYLFATVYQAALLRTK